MCVYVHVCVLVYICMRERERVQMLEFLLHDLNVLTFK